MWCRNQIYLLIILFDRNFMTIHQNIKMIKDKSKELDGDEVVRKYLKANLKCYMGGWKKDSDKMVIAAQKRGYMTVNRCTCQPYYLSERAWDGLVRYWETEAFSKMLENGKKNVQRVEIRHCSGAKPFEHRYKVIIIIMIE